VATETVISTQALVKHYGEVRAVDGIDLAVRRGEIYGFLGRNGAGKTTTIRMLLGLIQPTSGQVTVLGHRVRPGEHAVLGRVGCLVETATAYPNLTVRENLELGRRLHRAPRRAVVESITLLGLGDCVDRPAGELSLGNKQRLGLARALLHEPEVLVLDEPANALDPAGIVEVRELLRRLAEERKVTIFMSSHILAEVAHLAHRIGIVHRGLLVEELGYEELRARSRRFVEVAVSEPERATTLLAEHLGISRVEETPEGRLRVFEGLGRTADMARVLVNAGLDLTHLSVEEEDLEAHFLRLTAGEA
jgi:ABC-2 type transport system ATP-binding protein